ncbi:MAG TPA: hypothetical protein VHI13_16080 [Candidatus Kapabacteria bacterium]|nr:hypothetical protein [Candidatus Kapabacteria bacterium]
MKNYRRTLVLWVVLQTSVALPVFAQSITINPIIGYEVGALLSIRRDSGTVNPLPDELKGTSRNDTYWFGLGVTLHPFEDDRWYILGRFGMTFAHGSFISTPFDAPGIRLRNRITDTVGTQHLEFESSQTQAQADVIVMRTLTGTFAVGGGLWTRIRLGSTTANQERVVEPDGAIYTSTGNDLRPLGSGSGIESFPTRFGAMAGAAVSLPALGAFTLQPAVMVRADIDGLLRSLGMRALSLEAGVGIHFDIGIQHDTLIREAPASNQKWALTDQPKIDAAIRIVHSDTSSGRDTAATIVPRRTEYHAVVPYIPAVAFEGAEETIPSRYLGTHPSADEAAMGDSAERTACARYGVLNAIGSALQRRPEGSVSIVVPSTAGGANNLAARRAEQIRSYFADTWGIERNRVSISTSHPAPGAAELTEPNVLLLKPSSIALLPPRIGEWNVDDYITPEIGIVKRLASRYGIRDWQIAIRQGTNIIARFADTDALGGDMETILPWNRLALQNHPEPLVAELTASDFVGTSDTARSILNLQVADGARNATRDQGVLRPDGDARPAAHGRPAGVLDRPHCR